MNQRLFPRSMLAALLAAGLCCGTAVAGPYVSIPNPVTPEPGGSIPPPNRVPGKEYVNEVNTSSTHPGGVVVRPGQTTLFDGSGGIKDGIRFPAERVDAIANKQDVLFEAVIANKAAALFSTRDGAGWGTGVDVGAPGKGCAAGDPICYESIGGAIGTWATWAQVDQNKGNPSADPNGLLKNLIGLEVWGPEGFPDSTHYSEFGDPNGCSIFNADGTCYLGRGTLAIALGLSENLTDLDALMMQDLSLDTEFGAGDSILFSLAPAAAAGFAIGDAAYVWRFGQNIFNLDHGGHLWTDGWLGLNVDALEAVSVPEPGSLALVGLALVGLVSAGRRSRTQ